MRVISGKYKGKNLKGFNLEGTRPTMDRVKESVFGIIQNNIINSTCLDLFAGSGSLGIEALSNGAKECIFVEKNKDMVKILKENLNTISNNKVLNMDYTEALNQFKNNNIQFDIIFLDPPYKLNLINNTLDFIYQNQLLKPKGIIVCEYENELVNNENFKLKKEKKYGSKKVKIYEI